VGQDRGCAEFDCHQGHGGRDSRPQRQDDTYGEKLGNVPDMIASDIQGDIERLKELLGLGKEVRP
jgi:hypothetical protein